MSALRRLLLRAWNRVSPSLDDALPMPLEEREERDFTGESSEDESARRTLRFHIRMLEKRGKGGFR